MTWLVARVDVDAAEGLAAAHGACFAKPWSADDFAELIATPGAIALASADERGVAGLILIRAVEGEAEILTVAVHPRTRRAGLGRQLVEAAARAAAAAGAKTLWLEVGVDNAAALALYEVAGFEAAGRRKAYYQHAGGAEDALILRRVLNTMTP